MDCEKIIAAIQAAPQAASPAYDRIEALLTAVAVIVAAIGVILTFLTLAVAGAAFVGRKRFVKLAKGVARETAEPIAREVAQLWVEKYATPEALYSALAIKNVLGPSGGPPTQAVEASESEDTPPVPDVAAEPQVAVAQPYPGREEQDVVRPEEPIEPEHAERERGEDPIPPESGEPK
jgi:hypothetical protein